MRDVLQHRGPDDRGMFLDDEVGLGHRRLSIVDVRSGHQPMANEDRSVYVTYNGEIYNHADFRKELQDLGHRFSTHCDTEVILHLYEEHGANCVHLLRGMFAFAIWDRHKRRLFLARDRLGVKPLYYVLKEDGSFYFASEIKALLASGAVKGALNFAALPDYLANHSTSSEETLFAKVRRLLPGHYLIWEDGRIRVEKYWDVTFSSHEDQPDLHTVQDDSRLVSEWSELFSESVRLRLMADVPLGMFLSGGIDSSAIAAVMSELVDRPVKTFSVAFNEREANELHYARLVAKSLKTDHHEILLDPNEFFRALPALVWHEDEPLAHPSSVALFFVSRLASEHVKVVLTGEGSDEMLAGYGRYYRTLYNLSLGTTYHRLTPSAIRDSVSANLFKLDHSSFIRQKLSRTFLCLPPTIESLYFENFAVFTRAMQYELLTPETREQIGGSLDPYHYQRRCYEASNAGTTLDRMLYTDVKCYLHELLMKQDQMSMAASIESRVPFLDHKLLEFSARLPQRLKLRRGWKTKYVLRQSMKKKLPKEILQRRKMGFPVPVGAWFRGAYRWVVDEYVLSERALSRNLFNVDALRRLASEHQEGANHTERLWSLVNFEIWQRQAIDGDAFARL